MSKFEDFLNTTSAIAPVWYKNESIFYLHNKTGTYQIYSYNIKEKTTKQYTDYTNGIISYSISDTLNILIFTKASDGDEQSQIYTINITTGEQQQLTKNPSVRHNLGSLSNSKEYITYSSNKRNGKDMDIYLLSLKTGTAKMIRKSKGIAYATDFSPDDKYLTILQNTTNVTNEIFIYDLNNNAEKQLSNNQNSLNVGGAWLNEKELITNSNINNEYFRLIKYNIDTGHYTELFSEQSNNDIVGYKLSDQKNTLFVVYNIDGYSVPKLFKKTGEKFILQKNEYKKGMYGRASFSPKGDYIVYSYGNDTNTYNIYRYALKTQKQIQLSNAIQKISPDTLTNSILRHYKSFDKLKVPYFIYLPDKQNIDVANAPILINIHGGPESQYRPGFNSTVQYFVSIGFIVVCPNIRGSAGYGKSYLALDDKEKRMDSVEDIKYLAKDLKDNGYKGKMILHGGSYGGFVVYAALAKYSNLWSAGISIVGISNFITFLENTAPYRRNLRESEYGSLQNDRKFLKKISPTNMAQNIKTPTLIIHGKNDPRVPLDEAKQMYTQLTDQGIYTELIVYENEGHGLSKLQNRIDAYKKITTFLKKYL